MSRQNCCCCFNYNTNKQDRKLEQDSAGSYPRAASNEMKLFEENLERKRKEKTLKLEIRFETKSFEVFE